MTRRIHACALALACACLPEPSSAGYRNLTPEEVPSAKVRAATPVSAASQWTAEIIRADGRILRPANKGDRFASVELQPREKCAVRLTVPGLPDDGDVSISATHGGSVDGDSRKSIRSKTRGVIAFDFEMGVMGAHPVVVTVHGRSVTLLFQIEPKTGAKGGGR